MAHWIQVGTGSGGMVVLDLLCRDDRLTRVTLIEPDVYKPHNAVRHYFPPAAAGRTKAELAAAWVRDRRPDLAVDVLAVDLLAADAQPPIEEAAAAADIGVCAVDNEPAKYHFDALMRKHGKPWALGEVLSGGIGGWVHRFAPGGPCYGCVASHLKREAPKEEEPPPPADYSDPDAATGETSIPASKASIEAIASLHAGVTLDALAGEAAEFSSLLFTLRKVPGVFDEAYRAYKFRIPRADGCLVCGRDTPRAGAEGGDLDVAVDEAIRRLGGE